MKRYLMGVLILLLLIVFPVPVSAHLGGVPYFKVNGDYTLAYPVQSASTNKIFFPQDIAPKNYLVNQQLNLEFDTALLPFTKEVIAQSTFNWDFGDGTKGLGLANTHSYSKTGSYFVVITVSDPNTPPQVIQSMLINILPSLDYQLPQFNVLVDGQQIATDSAKFHFSESWGFTNLAKHLTFAADVVGRSSSGIDSFTWVFDDGQIETGQSINTQLDPTYYYSFPVLRVKDKNGFIEDQELRIENLDKTENPPISKIAIGGGIGVIVLVIGLGIWLIKKGMAKKPVDLQ